MSRRDLTAVLAVLALLAAAASAAGAEDARDVERSRATSAAGEPRTRTESDREAKIRKAREEIRKNPAQKQFILFRYGLKEEDL